MLPTALYLFSFGIDYYNNEYKTTRQKMKLEKIKPQHTTFNRYY